MKNKTILKWISSSIKGKKRYLIILSLLQIMLGILSVGFAFMLKYVAHGLEIKDKEYFLNSIYILLAIVVLILIFTCLYRFLFEYACSDIDNSLKKRMYDDLLHSSYKMVRGEHKEEWINRLCEDTKVVSSNMLAIIPVIGRMSVQLIAAFAAIIYISPSFGLILLPISLFLVLLTYVLRKRLKIYHNKVQDEQGKYKIFLSESFEGLSIIHSFVKEDVIEKIEEKRLDEFKKARVRKNNFSLVCSLGFLFLYYGSYLFGIIFCGFKILSGEFDLPSLASIIALLSEIQGPIGNLTSILPHYYSLLASAERLMLVGEKERVREYSSKEIEKEYSSFKEIRIDDISFSYEENKEVFSSFSLTIKKNDHLILYGPSGKGKSTLLKLLLSLYEVNKGKIEMVYEDRISPLKKEDRNLFAYVPQDNLLLKGSIRENVTFFAKDIDEERLKKAYIDSNAIEFVSSLEKGDETSLNDRGAGLSIGQMQRLSIARALYSNKPILLLDEISSSLDKENTKIVLDNLFKMEDKTIILITHHLEDVSSKVRIVNLGEK